jgi:muramidase (phage lysozyme)
MKKFSFKYSVLVIFMVLLQAQNTKQLNYSPMKMPAPVIGTDKASLIGLSKKTEVRAFLDLLAHGEGTSYHRNLEKGKDNDEYRITFCDRDDSGKKIKNNKLLSFNDHPRVRCCNPVGDREICATAAGRYMFLQKTWDWVKDRIELRDFSPVNQDLAAIFLLVISGAMAEILKGDIKEAIAKASRFWAPMPGNKYNQPQTKINELLRIYETRLKFYQSFNFSYPQRNGRP